MKYNEVLLSKFDVEIIDGDRGKNYPSKIEFSSDGHTLFLNNKNVISNKLDTSFGDYISKERSNLLRKGKLERGDIVLTTRGSIGNVGFYSNNIIQEHIRINSGMVIIRNHDSRIFTPFLYLLLRSDYAKEQYEKLSSGSVQKQLPIRDLKFFNVLDVPFYKQNKIWNIINTFDSKIELNNQIISNLEELASTLFKRWFVDFEFPDENGNPYKSSGGKMVDSELGEIPNDFNVQALHESIEVKYGKDHKKLDDGEFPVYGSGGLMRFAESYLFSGESVLIPRKGSLNNIMYVNESFWTVDTMFFTKMKKKNIAKFIYLLLKKVDLASMNVGSAVPSMTTAILNSMPIIMPFDSILEHFEKIILPVFMLKNNYEIENKTLADLRDSLLSKLLSGEIELPEDEEV